MNATDDILACTDFILAMRRVCDAHALGLSVRDGQLVIVDADGGIVAPLYGANLRPSFA